MTFLDILEGVASIKLSVILDVTTVKMIENIDSVLEVQISENKKNRY